MKYSEIIQDHFTNPRNVGPMQGTNAVGESVNPACMDRMRLYLRIVEGQVVQASYEVEGCVPAIAMGSLLTELVAGKKVRELHRLTAAELEREAGGLPNTKKHAAHLAYETLQDALR